MKLFKPAVVVEGTKQLGYPESAIIGIGLASFIEVTNPSAAFYGVGGARISSQDGAVVR